MHETRATPGGGLAAPGHISTSPRSRGLGRVVAGVIAAASASSSHAQVLEVGAGGAVQVYDGPAVFTDQGVQSLKPRPTLKISRGASPDLAAAAAAVELSPDLLRAVAWRESGGHAGRVSPKGAIGVMQLMPATARDLGVDATDEAGNVTGGAIYLRRMMARYDGDLVRALAAYNAGPKAVDRYRGVPPFKETQAYVAAILDRLSQTPYPLADRTLK